MKTTKNIMLRIVTAILTLLLVLPAVSCDGNSKSDAPANDNAPASDAVTSAVETEDVGNIRSDAKDSLPDNLNLENLTFTIYVVDDSGQNNFYGGPEEEKGEIVDDAVLQRNRTVEERLKIDLKYQANAEATWVNIGSIIQKYLKSGDETIDLFIGQQFGVVQIVAKGGFVNANELEYIDFDMPWWNNAFMDQLEICSGTRHLLAGDYIVHTLSSTHTLYYNKVMYDRFYHNPDGLYDNILDGSWTLDIMSESAKGVFNDLNGNAKTDIDDQLGFVANGCGWPSDAFMYCGDIAYSGRDEDGFKTIDMLGERGVNLTEKIVDLFHNPGSCYMAESVEEARSVFTSGESLFLGGNDLGSAVMLRDMEDNFGFLPYPKLDEEQDRYYSLVSDGTLLALIPSTSQNLDYTGAVLEALSSETYRTVIPAWFETALKVKYSRDNISAQILDIIHDSSYSEFLFAYNPCFDSIGVIINFMIEENDKDYVSRIESISSKLNEKLENLNKNFIKNY